jgi:hypothetical protein
MPAEEYAMKKKIDKRIGTLLLAFFITTSLPLFAQPTLPDYMKVDLKRIEETWNVLDQYAEKIWPGWKNYAAVPFRLHYPNGVQLLIGHPSPTDGFELVPGIEPRGKKVYVDRRNEIPLKLEQPLGGGGGILPFGKDTVVQTVDLRMGPISLEEPKKEAKKGGEEEEEEALPKELRTASERQILTNIHELFHCFQREVYKYRYGNLRANTDANYAIYAEIEGLALEKAYLETDSDEAKEYLKDFLAARMLKRRSLTEEEQNQESEDDLMEGTAVYSEAMSLELMKKGYRALVTKEEDPYFLGFKDIDQYLKEKLDSLKSSGEESMDARMKCYAYGCFQALLLTRYFPGWQTDFFKKNKFMDEVIGESLGVTKEGKEEVGSRLKDRYPIGEITARHTKQIQKRDDALKMIEGRRGRVYIINFKPTQEYLLPTSAGEVYRVGLINIFPDGIERIKIQDVVFEGRKTPIIQDQLYYVKWVDTEAKEGARGEAKEGAREVAKAGGKQGARAGAPAGVPEKGYRLSYSRKEGEDIYYDAEFTTKGFTLKAPKIQVKDIPAFVKVTVVGKVKE